MDRHRVDPTSLVFGLLFVVVGQMLLSGDPVVGTVSLGWIGPVVAVGLGILIVIAARPRRSSAAAKGDGSGDNDIALHVSPVPEDVEPERP